MRAVLVAAALALAGHALAQESPPLFSHASAGAALPRGWSLISLPYGHKSEIQLVADQGSTVLRVSSAKAFGAAAAVVHVDASRTPVLHWRWKIDRVVDRANLDTKEGEDFAARVYVAFDYPLGKLSFTARTKLSIARSLYDFVPSAAICYVWDNKHAQGTSRFSPHFDHVRMIVLETGNARAGQWVEESRDVAADFRAAFAGWKGPVPQVSGVVAGNDTDQTGEKATAWFGDFLWKPAL